MPLILRAGLRADHADLAGLGVAVLHGGVALVLGAGARRRRRWRAASLAYKFSPHVHDRIQHFINPDSVAGGVSDTFQVDTALQAMLNGGWLGRGPGEGAYKRILPDAHTDFVFAVAGEEFGMIACLGLIAFFGFIVIRGLWLASRNHDPFCRFAAAGLTIMFGVQSWINMAVNLQRHSRQGHDAAVHLLRRLVGDRARDRHGFPGRADAAQSHRAQRAGPRMNVLLAAGGTGGHLFPAAALASALSARGIDVDLATDDRALKYGGDFPARAIHAIPSATPTQRGSRRQGSAPPPRWRAASSSALALLRRLKPAVVVGFGGYPTVPPLVAASLLRRAQHSARAERRAWAAPTVSSAAASASSPPAFPISAALRPALKPKLRYTGNPVRPAVLAAAATPYPDFADGRLRVLVTGGSQGARVMSEVVPAALAQLAPEERARLSLTLQARGEDRAKAAADCERLGFAAEIAEFFPDLPARIAAAHLVVARAGASTVSELAVIGRPAILVPYPHALDQDQAANAALLAQSGAATVVRQSRLHARRARADLARSRSPTRRRYKGAPRRRDAPACRMRPSAWRTW